MKNLFIIFSFLLSHSICSQVPVFEWTKRMGGTEMEMGITMVTDTLNNVYIGGVFSGTVDFDPGPGVFNMTYANPSSVGGDDIFITKLDSTGNFIWAKRIGGISNEQIAGMTIDPAGNIYATGLFFDDTVDFDPGPGVYNMGTVPECQNMFILKLDSSGNFLWAKNFITNGTTYSNAIASDAFGNIYTTGEFFGSVDFDPGSGTFYLSATTNIFEIFLLKLDSSGNFGWARRLKASSPFTENSGNGIAADAAGNVCITGFFQETVDFDPGAGTYNLTSAPSSYAIFVAKYNATGNIMWARNMGGNSTNDMGRSITTDTANNIYTTGSFYGNCDFDPGGGTYMLNAPGTLDVFISKLDASGNFVWAKSIYGTGGQDRGSAIALDKLGNVYTAGGFIYSTDFDPGSGTIELVSSTGDAFVSKLDSYGNYLWAGCATSTIGSSPSLAISIALDRSGSIYSTGFFYDTDFNPSSDTFHLSSNGYGDVFVMKLNQQGLPTPVTNYTGNADDIQIFPNPFLSETVIRYPNSGQPITMIISDLTGREMQVISLNKSPYLFEKETLQPGIYILKFTNADKLSISKRIVVQ
ncbi:MAG: Protein of unknown function precursor [Bacteroidetes bacterium]|nr:Protein of unknown function precursor [Bacteroidota bacterium]